MHSSEVNPNFRASFNEARPSLRAEGLSRPRNFTTLKNCSRPDICLRGEMLFHDVDIEQTLLGNIYSYARLQLENNFFARSECRSDVSQP